MAPPVRRTAVPVGRRTAAPAASLLPENAAGGFEVPEGDYLWKDVYVALHDYNGTVAASEAKPAIFVVLQSIKDQEEFTVPYLAGKQEFMVPNDEGTYFVHPDGESTPTFYKQGDAIKLLKSLIAGNYPHDKMGEDPSVAQFIGLKAHMIPTPKNKGKSNRSADSDDDAKTIPIVEKIIAMPGAKAPVPTRATAGATRTAPTGAASRGAQRATQQDNGEPEGEVDVTVMEKVQEALTDAKDNSLSRVKLAMNVWALFNKAKEPRATEYRKIAGDANWLEQNAEQGGWTITGDTVSLA